MIKYRHYTFQVDRIRKLKKQNQQIIIFKVEILTNKKLKNE